MRRPHAFRLGYAAVSPCQDGVALRTNSKDHARWRAPLGLLALLALLAAGCIPDAAGNPRIAAKVDGTEISLDTVEDRYEAVAGSPQVESQLRLDADGSFRRQLQAQVLTQLIRSELLERGARELGLEVTAEDVAETRAEIVEEVGGEDAFQLVIEQNNLTETDVERELRNIAIQDAVEAALTSDIEVTEAEIRQRYEQERETRYELAAARHIMVASEAEAQEVIRRLEAGEDFAALAAELSLDEGTRDAGGDLGEFTRGRYPEQFEDAVFAAQAGDIVGPMQIGQTWHVIEVTDRRSVPFAEVEDEIREEILTQQRGDLLTQWQQANADQAEITVNPRFGRWDPVSAQVVTADPLGDTRPSLGEGSGIELDTGGGGTGAGGTGATGGTGAGGTGATGGGAPADG